ncbi:endonuclease [Solibacillus silvestris]|nr:chitobiase/beta-hexosaminidase C-terminal domain-containing protein [Solibacillus silvestris]OBW58856.1 endonuclease [Solibacillus silvestris]
MKNSGLNYISKIAFSFLLVLSMILPHFAVVKAEATGAIGIDEAISQFDPASVKPDVTVEGYIVGFAKSETSYVVEAETDTNIAIADTPGETDVKKMLYIQLPNSPASIRTEFGLKTNPSNLGKKVVITGSLEKYFGNHAGLKSPTFIQFAGNDTPNPEEPTQVATVKASPATGEVYAGTKVTLSTATPNATIYYTTDGSEPTTESTVYNGSTGIVINEAKTIKAFATATDLDNSEVATFAYTIKTAPTAISIEEARNKAIGEEVIVSGIVTAKMETATAHIQDETGAAIAIYPVDILAANVGDLVTVQGKVAEYSGLKQLTNISLVGTPTAATLPNPQVITSEGIAENNESRLVTLKNVEITGSGQNFTGTDAAGTFAIYDKLRDSGLVSGKTYGEITGIVGQFTNHQLLPIRIIEDTTKVQDVQASHTGGVTAGTDVTLSTITEGATIYYTVDGSTPTTASTEYTSAITVNNPMTIKAIAVKDGLTNSAVATFVYEIIDTDNATISDIQGANHTSPYAGLQVNDVDGVVTFVMDAANFIMQENTQFDGVKSTAIKVNKSSHGVSVGDAVKVTGNVTEVGGNTRLKDTQIAATEIEKTGTAAVPETLVIGEDLFPPNRIIDNDSFAIFDPQEDGIDFWESIEYMLVSFPEARVVGPMYNNDSPIVVPGTTNNTFNDNGGLNIAADDYNPEKIMLEGVSGKNYESGDYFNDALIGFVENFSDGYRLNTNKVFPEVIKANIQQEVTHLDPVADKLNLASYNIENFSNNKDNTSDEKAAKIASTFVNNMKSPDIITLVEVQDNDGQTDSGNADASESYLRLINAIKVAGGPQYDWIDVMPINNTSGGAPGGNIRVGYLYNPERVSLVDGTNGTGEQANAWTEEGSLALNPGFVNPSKFEDTRKPIAAEFEFQEERIVVIGAHLNSKGGDDSLWGPTQPPVLGSEPERIELAQVINDFIDEGLAKDPDVNIVVAGDMNDFEFTPALETLKGGVLTNMVDKAPVEDRFSYYFQGNNQVLDHILVSNNLAEVTEIDMIHINANFTEAQGRASDHDPVLVQIDLESGKEETPEPIIPENVYDYKNYKTGKLIINRPSISLTLGENTDIKNGIAVFSEYAEFHGVGFADKTVTISPKKGNAIIDFKGTKIGKIIIEGNHVKEIRNLTPGANIQYVKGADEKSIEFK